MCPMSQHGMTAADANPIDIKFFEEYASDMPGGFFVYRADGDEEILFVNERVLAIFECDSMEQFRELTGNTFIGLVYPDDVKQVERQISSQIANGDDNYDYVQYRIKTAKGNIRYIEDFGRRVHRPDGDLFYVFIDDIQVKHRVDDVDYLTGLLNMDAFERYSHESLAEFDWENCEQQPAFISFDMENFKFFNESYGYREGDEFLRQVGSIIKSEFSDGLVARFSDDHFVVYTEHDHYEEHVKNIHRDVHAAHLEAGMEIKAGVYLANRGDSPTSSVDRAKTACNAIKKNYLSVVRLYDEGLWKRLSMQNYVVDHIDEAIEKGWIEVYYQPIVRTMTRKVCSLEALVRWNDPTYGFLSPADFIETLEQTNLAYKIDTCVARIIGEDYRRCVDAGRPVLPVSINLSRTDFIACDMAERIKTMIDAADMPHDMLHVEITESALSEEDEPLTSSLDAFREEGFSLWMDDFGSGYSTLNVLKNYDFDLLKIDLRFLDSFAASERSNKARSIIMSVVAMAKQIGMTTLAEGVETEEQFEFLYSIGCEMAQGFLFSRPQPIDVFYELELEIEPREDAAYYENVGKVEMLDRGTFEKATFIVANVQPAIMLEYVDGAFNRLGANDVLEEELLTRWGMTVDDAIKHLNTHHDGNEYQTMSAAFGRLGESLYEEVDLPGAPDPVYFELRFLAHNERTGATAALATVLGWRGVSGVH